MDAEAWVRPMIIADLPAVLSWRNHPDVRRYMLTQHEIDLEEHTRWFERASQDPSRRLLVVEAVHGPLGFVHFSGVAAAGVADWGFYAVPGAPKGSGRRLGRMALAHAFDVLDLHKVCGQALDFNEASVRFHLSLGFQREGVLRQQCRVNGRYHDLVCFGLLSNEWKATQSG